MALTEQQKQQILAGLKGGGAQISRPTSRFNAAQIKQITTDDDSKRLLSLKNLDTSLSAYKDLVSTADRFKFFDTGKIDSSYADLKIKYKEAANLGALTGPDVTLLEEAIKPIAGGLGKAIKFKLGGGTAGALAGIEQIQSTAQQDKDRLGMLISSKYGKDDPYLKFMLEGTKAAQINPLEAAGIQMTPQLQQLIEERKRALGKLPQEAPEQPQQPTDERTGFEKVLGTVSAPFRAFTGKTGEVIGEAIGTKIARARATPEQQQFIEGPSKGALAKDIGMAAFEIAGAGVAGKVLKGGLKLAAPVINKLQQSRKLKQTLDLIRPSLSTAEKEAAISSGRVKTSKGLFGKSYEIPPSKYDVEIADTVKGMVKKGWSPEKNIGSIRKNVSKIDAQLQEGLSIRNAPVNKGTVKNFLDKIKNSDETQFITAGDKQAKQIYESVINNFLSGVKKLDNKGLFDARKSFDKGAGAQIKNLFGEQFGSVRKQAVLDIRKGVNDFIAQNLPKGEAAKDLIFKEALQKEHRMLNAIENIAEQIAKKVGKPTFLQKAKKAAFSPQAIGAGVAVSALGGVSRAVKGED